MVLGPILAVFLLEKPSHRRRAHHRARPGLRWGEYSRDQAAHCADRTREEETCPTMRYGASRGHHVFSPVDTCKNVGEMRHQRAMQTMRRLANRGARSAGYWNLFHTSPLAPRTPRYALAEVVRQPHTVLGHRGTPAGRCRADSLRPIDALTPARPHWASSPPLGDVSLDRARSRTPLVGTVLMMCMLAACETLGPKATMGVLGGATATTKI